MTSSTTGSYIKCHDVINRFNNNLLQEMRNLDEGIKSKDDLKRVEIKTSSYQNPISGTFDLLPRTSDACSSNQKPYNQGAHEGPLSCKVGLLLILWPNRSNVPTPKQVGQGRLLELSNNMATTENFVYYTYSRTQLHFTQQYSRNTTTCFGPICGSSSGCDYTYSRTQLHVT